MSTPPEANTEYSRGPEDSRGVSGSGSGVGSGVLMGVLIGGGLAALLLLVAEFTTLYQVQTSTNSAAINSVTAGSNNSYAMIPLALLAGFFAFGVWRTGSRVALLAVGLLGVIALLISLLGDLPNAHASGLVRIAGGRFATANATPSTGFYMETLGAVLLLITAVSGFLMLPAPTPAVRRRNAGDAEGGGAGGKGGQGRRRGPAL
jgi:hypothetical protein